MFQLPDSFDSHLKGVSRSRRAIYRRNLNKLNKAFDFEVDVGRDGPELEREFDAFIAMHQVQWRAINRLRGRLIRGFDGPLRLTWMRRRF